MDVNDLALKAADALFEFIENVDTDSLEGFFPEDVELLSDAYNLLCSVIKFENY